MFAFVKKLFKPKPSNLDLMREALKEALQAHDHQNQIPLNVALDQLVNEENTLLTEKGSCKSK